MYAITAHALCIFSDDHNYMVNVSCKVQKKKQKIAEEVLWCSYTPAQCFNSPNRFLKLCHFLKRKRGRGFTTDYPFRNVTSLLVNYRPRPICMSSSSVQFKMVYIISMRPEGPVRMRSAPSFRWFPNTTLEGRSSRAVSFYVRFSLPGCRWCDVLIWLRAEV